WKPRRARNRSAVLPRNHGARAGRTAGRAGRFEIDRARETDGSGDDIAAGARLAADRAATSRTGRAAASCRAIARSDDRGDRGSEPPKLQTSQDRRRSVTRRDFFPIAGASLLAGYAGFAGAKTRPRRSLGPSSVAIVKAASYSDDLVTRMLEGVRACGLDVR